jgi:hypothetical protein
MLRLFPYRSIAIPGLCYYCIQFQWPCCLIFGLLASVKYPPYELRKLARHTLASSFHLGLCLLASAFGGCYLKWGFECAPSAAHPYS